MIKNTGLTKKEQQAIIEEMCRLPELEEVLLYGSRAMGNFKRGSDVDLAIKGENVTDQVCNRLHYQLNEETLLPYFFDVTNYAQISNPALKEHIDHEGKLFYSSK